MHLSPTLGTPPVPLRRIDRAMADVDEYFRRMLEFIPFTPLFNVTGSAGVSPPLWWNAESLPIGVQFVTRTGRDGTLCGLAAQLERAQSWAGRKPPLP